MIQEIKKKLDTIYTIKHDNDNQIILAPDK